MATLQPADLLQPGESLSASACLAQPADADPPVKAAGKNARKKGKDKKVTIKQEPVEEDAKKQPKDDAFFKLSGGDVNEFPTRGGEEDDDIVFVRTEPPAFAPAFAPADLTDDDSPYRFAPPAPQPSVGAEDAFEKGATIGLLTGILTATCVFKLARLFL